MRKNSIKNTRVNAEVQRELSNILRAGIKDPRVAPMTSVVAVEVAPDLKTCKAYISVLGDEKAQQKAGGGDKQRISHAAASSPACQPKWDGQRQAEKPGGAEGNQPRPCDNDTGKVIDLPVPEIRPCCAHKSGEEQCPL